MKIQHKHQYFNALETPDNYTASKLLVFFSAEFVFQMPWDEVGFKHFLQEEGQKFYR